MTIALTSGVARLLPVAWVLGGIVVGFIAYTAIFRPLQRAGQARGWAALSTVSAIAASVAILWGALAGLYIGLDRVALSARDSLVLDRVIGALFVFSLTWIAARLAAASIASFGRRSEGGLFSVSLYSTLVQGAIICVGLLTVFSSLGIAIAPLLTTLGLGGLAVALALNDTLTNLFAGVHIVASRQIRVGDFVKFDFAEGEVTDIKWHNTTIRGLQNDVIVIPNAKVNTSVFTNYSLSVSDIAAAVSATLAWKGSYAALEALAMRAAQDAVGDTAGRLPATDCRIVFSTLNETSLQITAYLPIQHAGNRVRASSEFLRRLYDGTRDAHFGADRIS